MPRRTRILGFSVAPEIAAEYERLATRQRTTKSDLFRQMLEVFEMKLEEDEFLRLQARMSRRARAGKRGLLTAREVERTVLEDR